MSIVTSYGNNSFELFENKISGYRGDTINIPICVGIDTDTYYYRAHLRRFPNDQQYFVLSIIDNNIVISPNQSQCIEKGNWVTDLEQIDDQGNVTTIQRTIINIIEDITRDTIYPNRRDFIIIQGETWSGLASGVVLNINKEPANLTDSIIEFKIVSEKGDTTALIEKTYALGGIIVSDPLLGEFVIPSFTMTLDSRTEPYYWFIFVELMDGFRKIIAEGYIKVE